MREYTPDNYSRFVVHETERERRKRLQARLQREWDEMCDSELEELEEEEEEDK